MSKDTVPRRQFLLGAGLVGTSLAGTAIAAGLPEPAEVQQGAPAAAAPTQEAEPFVNLTALEAAFIVAAVDTLIPADELSPSGSDCGVAIFIDRQLGSAWGGGAKMYRTGPFVRGKPEQGYQLPLTPREYFAAGIAAANAWSHKTCGKDFERAGRSRRCLEGHGGRQGDVREFRCQGLLRPIAWHHDGRLLRRSDLWRQS